MRINWSMFKGYIDVEAVYEVPSFADDLAAFSGADGAGAFVVDSVDAAFDGASPDGAAAGVVPSLPELSEPEDSDEDPSVVAVFLVPPERLSVL
jgi:hypothetical protein